MGWSKSLLTLCVVCIAGQGCAATTDSPLPEPRPSAAVAPTPSPTPPIAMDFETWKADFRSRALTSGVAAPLFDRAFAGVTPDPVVIERDRFQPEFVRPIWEYLDSAVSDTRVRNGRRLAAEKAPLLAEIERRHGVDAEVVLAIWGLESAFGANYGSRSVIRSLATLAHDGRRRGFAEEQLLAALSILEAGDIEAPRMVGSWAGAMGHTQFIPTSFTAYAVDFDGDGRRNVWAADAADALASTANYLASFGWERGAPAAVEVRLPPGFDFALADTETRTAADWSALGIQRARGGALPQGQSVRILLPAGAGGPAFAIYPNFRVIRRYNNATSYALAVSLLAQRIDGAPGLTATWPRDDRALSRDETREVQERLTDLGFDTQGVDGIAGPNTRNAVRAWQRATGRVPDGYISGQVLSNLRASSG
ncbi:MAG: lytic murein transglycosylase [Pseudomonadota bacterium]